MVFLLIDMEKRKINKSLLEQFIAGQCSAEEAEQVNRFLQTPAGRSLWEEVTRQHWSKASQVEIDEGTLAAWKKELMMRLPTSGQAGGNSLLRRGRKYLFRYAAFWALCILGVVLYAYLSRTAQPVQETALISATDAGESRAFHKLPDGSRAYVAGDSKLSIVSKFGDRTREVVLYGEAYFDIEKDPDRPFIVHTGNVSTKVLGTAFKIRAYAKEDMLVSVDKGKVQVASQEGNLQKPVILSLGDELTYTKEGKVLLGSFVATQLERWESKPLVFNGVPFKDLLEEVGRWYGMSMVIEQQELGQIPITVTLDPQLSIRQVLDALGTVTDCTYRLEGKKVILGYK